jgi:nitroreductase
MIRGMTETATDPRAVVRPLIRTRQIRDFSDERLDQTALDAIADVARWSGSSQNKQPWRFIVVRDEPVLRQIAEIGLPQTRSLRTAPAAIAIALPDEGSAVSNAYDEGRATERMLVAATMLGLGAGISWILKEVREPIGRLLGLPGGWSIRTIVALGHPSTKARAPKSAPGTARRPRAEAVFDERWPDGQS